MMDKIKAGRKEYEILNGDYILFNGACYQFCAGDGRTLLRDGFNSYSYVRLPKKAVNTIPFEKMERKTDFSDGLMLIKWFF